MKGSSLESWFQSIEARVWAGEFYDLASSAINAGLIPFSHLQYVKMLGGNRLELDWQRMIEFENKIEVYRFDLGFATKRTTN